MLFDKSYSFIVCLFKCLLNLEIYILLCFFRYDGSFSLCSEMISHASLPCKVFLSDFIKHTVSHDHASCYARSSFYIVACSCCDKFFSKEYLFGSASSIENREFIKELRFTSKNRILFWHKPSHSKGSATRSDRYLVNWV